MALPGNATDAMEFVHMTYGELVKNFGLNTTHTFLSWDRLSETDQNKWVVALTAVHAQTAAQAGTPAKGRGPSAE